MTTTSTLAGLERRVREFCEGFGSDAPTSHDLLRFEEGVRAELDTIGREAMKRAFKAADFDDSEVWINGVQHSRVRRFTIQAQVDVHRVAFALGSAFPLVARGRGVRGGRRRGVTSEVVRRC
jgi:hypothetical protein